MAADIISIEHQNRRRDRLLSSGKRFYFHRHHLNHFPGCLGRTFEKGVRIYDIPVHTKGGGDTRGDGPLIIHPPDAKERSGKTVNSRPLPAGRVALKITKTT